MKKLNYVNYSINCPRIEESITFIDYNIDSKKGSPFILNKPEYPGVNFKSIPAGIIHVLDEKLQIVAEFTGTRNAAESTNVSRNLIRYSMNKQFINCNVNGNEIFVLFARNIENIVVSSVPIVVIDTFKNIAYSFPTVAAAIVSLHINKSSKSSFITNRYLKTGNNYLGRFQFCKESEYLGSILPIETKEPIIPREEIEKLPKNTQKGIVLYNIKSKEAIQFSKVGDLLRHIGVNPESTAFVKRYINPTKTYKNTYEFHYTDDFSSSAPGDLTKLVCLSKEKECFTDNVPKFVVFTMDLLI